MDIIKALTNPLWKKQVAIIIAGIYACLRGVAYLTKTPHDQLPQALDLISVIIPIQAWGGVWMVVGLIALVSGVVKNHTRKAWPLFVGMMSAWGAAYLHSFLISLSAGNMTNEWLSASSYMLPAFIIGILSHEAPIEKIENVGVNEDV